MTKKYILGAINFSILLCLITLLIIGLLTVGIYSTKINILIILILICLLIILLFLYLAKDYKKYNTGVFITLILNIIFVFQILDLNNTYSYITNICNKKYEYVTYNLYVQKVNTTYSNINKLENKKIGLLKTNKNNIKDIINKEIKTEYVEYNNINELSEGIKNGEIQAFIIASNDDSINTNDIFNKVRVIYHNKVKKNV